MPRCRRRDLTARISRSSPAAAAVDVRSLPSGRRSPGEEGGAVLLALAALSLMSLLGMFAALEGTTEVRISDNSESHIRAGQAALGGLNHARVLLAGPDFDDLLKGPDGVSDMSSANLALSRAVGFRNPLPWPAAQAVDITDPAGALAGMADDGLLHAGKSGGGRVLVPLTGIALEVPDPYRPGSVVSARYFVKVADNNGESSELARDPDDNPFLDGDGIILVRSMGIAATVREAAGPWFRRNSVVVYEARFRRSRAFELEAPLAVQGSEVAPSQSALFLSDGFWIDGGPDHPGLGVVDTQTADGSSPIDEILRGLDSRQQERVRGKGKTPSVEDITASMSGDPEKGRLMDPGYVWDLADRDVRKIADRVFDGNQRWLTASDAGFDAGRPGVTFVDGDLEIDGDISGAGVLFVRGKLSGAGALSFEGLILVIGAGELDASGLRLEVTGGVYLVHIQKWGTASIFGIPRFSVGASTSLRYDGGKITEAVRLLPPVQVGFREVTSTMDPRWP